jgi:hypothetical protein
MSYTQLSEDEVTTLLGQVNKKMKASEAALEALTVQLEKAEQDLQNKIDGYRLVADWCYLYAGYYMVGLHVIGKCVSYQIFLF